MNNERREISARDSSERPNSNHWWRTCKEEEADYTGKYRARSQGELSKETAANANQPMDPINAVHLARYAQHDRTNMGRY